MTILKALKGVSIKALQNDSREVKSGDVFLAYPGACADGRRFIKAALAAGAIAVIYELEGAEHFDLDALPKTIPLIAYPGLAKQLGALASQFYSVPEKVFNISGVTGTNGKTTIAYQLAQAHHLLGQSVTYMGTLGAGLLDAIKPLHNTTPDALCVQKMLYDWAEKEIQYIAMEVSSHGLCEGRVSEVCFTQAIYTNLSHEHLDYHKTFEAYAAAKARLFAYLSLESVILNQDDAHAGLMRSEVAKGVKILTYGLDNKSDVYAENIKLLMTGSVFDVQTPIGRFKCSVQALGRFNVYNSLAVIASLIADGYALSDIEKVMPKLAASPGRMEQVTSSPAVLVDYAHTPDALEKALETLKELEHQQLFVVFGCGGDRDKEKRVLMAKVAEKYADKVVITSDNPRTEDPHQILEEIKAGFDIKTNVLQIENRKEAIQEAFKLADADDIILIAGKGHETYQEIGHERFPFSDAAVVRQLAKS
ncbi:MAG: UDP-N-acetylmuramoyl-L-alanyl-D-glutamate--2,6-diaminopimelate ligase [Gammaproteobacteria bacterium]|nr:UDP-N-acetylmuramoyl-L-alanyl-D-glutamate--2,6-diaminopimelate ligase [Gammaproteobacteria bacterium]